MSKQKILIITTENNFANKHLLYLSEKLVSYASGKS